MEIIKHKKNNLNFIEKITDEYHQVYLETNEFLCKSFGFIKKDGFKIEVNGGMNIDSCLDCLIFKIKNMGVEE